MAQKSSSGLRSRVRVRRIRIGTHHAREIEAGRIGVVLGTEFGLPGGQGAEEKLADVRENGGAAGSDAIFSYESQEPGEEGVDLFAGFKAAETAGERGDVGGVLRAKERERMAFAEPGVGIGSEGAALASGGRTVLTAREDVGNAGVAGCWFHFGPRWEVRDGVPPRLFWSKSAEVKETKGIGRKIEFCGVGK